jgi:hypothetical protein
MDHFSNTRHMILYYEDVIRDQNVGIAKQMLSASDSCDVTQHCSVFFCCCCMQALSRVQEFLGVPVKKLFSKHVKIHTSPLPDLVSNWEDVSEMLNGTEYSRFLDDADYVS